MTSEDPDVTPGEQNQAAGGTEPEPWVEPAELRLGLKESSGELVPLAEGREAEVFLLEDGAVLKLMRDPAAVERVRREAAALSALAASGHASPVPHGLVTVDGRPGLVMDRIEGTDLLGALGRNPLSVFKAGAAIARCHVAIHECRAPDELPHLRAELRQQIESADPLSEDLRAGALRVLASLPDSDRLCHGDLHFGNLLGPWSAPVVIDWGNASQGDPVADVARTKLLLGIGEPGPGTPALVRVLAPIFRQRVVASYLATYRRLSSLDRALLVRWEAVQAAARLADGIPSERPKLIELLNQGLCSVVGAEGLKLPPRSL